MSLLDLFSPKYVCPECGGRMTVIENGDTLWCSKCGYDMDIDDYGEDPNAYDFVIGEDDEDESDEEYREIYDDVHGELDHHLED